ncbi:MAG: DNA double-strand break repair nuclease NurA [Acaryochloridaceae cyanobacterium RL_2_7]|nr:DNA double-strand break repair nuclease NurA [Acaryochloridaceae cyanobacterium RL_2_7]
MPLKPSEILAILNQKKGEFSSFNQDLSAQLALYRQAVKTLSRESFADLKQTLANKTSPGARPLEGDKPWPDWIQSVQLSWPSRQASLAWVRDRLQDVTTFSVDGSQIFPSKDLSIPVGLVQIGWFENPHSTEGRYTKDVRVAVLSPMELQQNAQNRPLDRLVNMHRFAMEVQRHIEFMEANQGHQDCITFFDGSLVGSFAEVLDLDCRNFYAQEFVRLLRTSEQCRVPLVGYVDTSNARDLVSMVAGIAPLPESEAIKDVQILNSNRMQWGDRTPLFICDRAGAARTQGILSQYQEQSQSVAFTYMKLNANRLVRLELPKWIHEDELLETVLNYVRSEVIIGSGYPYVIETADQVAVLRTEDRQMFYRILQDWSAEQDLDLQFSRKMVSKAFRRR